MNRRIKLLIIVLALLSGVAYSLWIGNWLSIEQGGQHMVTFCSTFVAFLYGFDAFWHILKKENTKSNCFCLLATIFQILGFTCLYKGMQMHDPNMAIWVMVNIPLCILFMICSDKTSKK